MDSNKPKALFRQIFTKSAKTFAVRVVGMVLLFGLHILLGNKLGSEQYGLLSFALSTTEIIAAIASLGLPIALLRFISQYQEEEDFRSLKGALILMPTVALLSSLIIAAAIWLLLFFALESQSFSDGLRLTVYLLPVFVLGRIRSSLLQGFRKPIASILPDEILRPIILGTAVFLLGVNQASLVVALYILTSVSLAGLFLLWLYHNAVKALIRTAADFRIRDWIGTALPMAFGGISYIIMNRTDTVMLGFLEDMNTVGIYSVANRIAMLSQFVLGSAAAVVIPHLTSAFHGNRIYEFNFILKHTRIRVLLLTLPLVLPMIIVPEKLLAIFGQDYVGGATLLQILVFGQLAHVAAGPVGSALLMTGQEKTVSIVMLLTALLNIVLNLIFIPRYGAIGAASVTAFCLFLANAVLVVVLAKSTAHN